MGSKQKVQNWIEPQARQLVDELVRTLDLGHGISSMSTSVYDTAWVSMVIKVFEGQKTWLFPEALDLLLMSNAMADSCQTYPSAVDGI